jgi:hypothetical protein
MSIVLVPREDEKLTPIKSTYPKPANDAVYAGLLGEYVQAVEPISESDPIAIFSQAAVMFGSIVGSQPHFKAEQDIHHLNEFLVVAAATSDGRKGVSIGHARRPFELVDPNWQRVSGLSSAEGLIFAVRDPSEKTRKGEDGKRVPEDAGVKDKRLMVEETEFASVIHRMRREANTLSTVLRQAWDSGHLRVLTKHSPLRATGAHISLVTHITIEELRKCLSETDTVNGFANRFLWVCARRSKLLPEGSSLDFHTITTFANRFNTVVKAARKVGQLHRSPKAKALWHDVYPDLTAGQLGLVGKATSRAAPHVMRLACLYALLDHKALIERRHLESALALWEYCAASARHIFGGHVETGPANKILQALRQHRGHGLTRKVLFEKVGQSHWDKEQLESALRELLDAGLARQQKEPTKGRTAERWFAV